MSEQARGLAAVFTAAEVRTEEEIRTFLDTARPWIYRLCLAITQQPSDAEDLAQEVIIRLWGHRDRLYHALDRRGYVRAAVVNLARSRRLHPIRPATECEAVEATCPHDIVAIRLAFGRLSGEDRILLGLVMYEGMTYSEVGQLLGIPEGTVGSRLVAAKARFRAVWEGR